MPSATNSDASSAAVPTRDVSEAEPHQTTTPVTVEETYQALLEAVRRNGTPDGLNLIAYSGGVDSTLVAHLVHTVFPHNTLAFIGVSHAMPMEQLELARDLAAHIGVPLRELETTEGEVEGYVANAGSACYYCKTTLYQTMQDFSRALALELATRTKVRALELATRTKVRALDPGTGTDGLSGADVVLFNGTNADDLNDPTRLGLKAAREFRVESPLQGLTKERVRQVSHYAGLPNWSYAASPCLRSRLQYGVPATPQNLRRVEVAEAHVRRMCGLEPQENLRVRHVDGDVALIELDASRMDAARQVLPDLELRLLSLGYREVSLRPFRSGSLSFLADIPV